jgi:hypothetical protein
MVITSVQREGDGTGKKRKEATGCWQCFGFGFSLDLDDNCVLL